MSREQRIADMLQQEKRRADNAEQDWRKLNLKYIALQNVAGRLQMEIDAMNQTKRKRGRPLEKPGAKRIGFYVSAEDHEWLTALTNRSEWIAKKVAEDKDTDKATNGGAQATTDTTDTDRTR